MKYHAQPAVNVSDKKIIPMLVPEFSETEHAYLQKCIASNWVAYTGPMVNEFEQQISELTGSPHCVATNSGTSALHLAVLCAGVKKDDLVPVSGLSFIAPANAVRYVGADPVFIDASPDDWQMDPDLLRRFLEEECLVKNGVCLHKDTGRRVPCMIIVHSLGYSTDMEQIVAIARNYHIKVIEDAAGALGSYFNGRHLGTFGDIGCLSFNGNKMITTGGGGALLTSDDAVAQRAYHLSVQTKKTDDYFHDEMGYNYRLTNLAAALGLAQLPKLPYFLQRKKEICNQYLEGLKDVPGARFATVRNGSQPNHWLFRAYMPNAMALMSWLNERGIQARSLWIPLHSLPVYDGSIFYSDGNHARKLFDHGVCFPTSTSLTHEDLDYILESVREFYADVSVNRQYSGLV